MTNYIILCFKKGKSFYNNGGANLPLHGTKLLVSIAINRSLGESIMRQAVTPAELHPKPMHIVKACLPCAWAF